MRSCSDACDNALNGRDVEVLGWRYIFPGRRFFDGMEKSNEH
jgi:hypothetical protein